MLAPVASDCAYQRAAGNVALARFIQIYSLSVEVRQRMER